ncbi:hypothetical protein ACFYKX_11535 [Cytobacillus sp. FJAT-54145]|uniref:Uncharacterized protein n=1 Tax=Cytobacillus spartinae TaxID=3299023 RepID=A0ABW6KEJ4_9BACI
MLGVLKKISKEDVAKEVERLSSSWESNPSPLHRKKLKTLSTLLNQKRIADLENMLDWKYHILMLKLEQLESIQEIREVDEVLLEAKNGKLLRIPLHSKYWLVEEECLFWMRKSLEAPLSHEGFERYMKALQLLCDKYGVENPLKKGA